LSAPKSSDIFRTNQVLWKRREFAHANAVWTDEESIITSPPKLLPGLIFTQGRPFRDPRGLFVELSKTSSLGQLGMDCDFRQLNLSRSARSTVRGLHFQLPPHDQGKLIFVTHGATWTVTLDVRPASATFGWWSALRLDSQTVDALWIPGGFAHGFQALEDNTELVYQCTQEYNPESESGVLWNDPDLCIEWPEPAAQISAKDLALPRLRNAKVFPRDYVFKSERS